MRLKCKVLTPIHISSGEVYERDFNFFVDEDIYIIDEFRILGYFIKNNFFFPFSNNKLTGFAKKIIKERKLYKRKINTNFNKLSFLYEHISSNSNPYIPASSIKGAIRSAILNCLLNINDKDYNQRCDEIYTLFENKKINKKRFENNFDKDFIQIFKNIIIRDTKENFKTQVYKTINIKTCKEHQRNRKDKTENIANFVEAIIPNQEFEIEIIDKKEVLKKIALIMNKYYIPLINDDIIKTALCPTECDKKTTESYFYKKGFIDIKQLKLNSKRFLINIGRFSGAYK